MILCHVKEEPFFGPAFSKFPSGKYLARITEEHRVFG
jgi:hypothetical protein